MEVAEDLRGGSKITLFVHNKNRPTMARRPQFSSLEELRMRLGVEDRAEMVVILSNPDTDQEETVPLDDIRLISDRAHVRIVPRVTSIRSVEEDTMEIRNENSVHDQQHSFPKNPSRAPVPMLNLSVVSPAYDSIATENPDQSKEYTENLLPFTLGSASSPSSSGLLSASSLSETAGSNDHPPPLLPADNDLSLVDQNRFTEERTLCERSSEALFISDEVMPCLNLQAHGETEFAPLSLTDILDKKLLDKSQSSDSSGQSGQNQLRRVGENSFSLISPRQFPSSPRSFRNHVVSSIPSPGSHAIDDQIVGRDLPSVVFKTTESFSMKRSLQGKHSSHVRDLRERDLSPRSPRKSGSDSLTQSSLRDLSPPAVALKTTESFSIKCAIQEKRRERIREERKSVEPDRSNRDSPHKRLSAAIEAARAMRLFYQKKQERSPGAHTFSATFGTSARKVSSELILERAFEDSVPVTTESGQNLSPRGRDSKSSPLSSRDRPRSAGTFGLSPRRTITEEAIKRSMEGPGVGQYGADVSPRVSSPRRTPRSLLLSTDESSTPHLSSGGEEGQRRRKSSPQPWSPRARSSPGQEICNAYPAVSPLSHRSMSQHSSLSPRPSSSGVLSPRHSTFGSSKRCTVIEVVQQRSFTPGPKYNTDSLKSPRSRSPVFSRSARKTVTEDAVSRSHETPGPGEYGDDITPPVSLRRKK